MKKLVLISCASRKLPHKARARDLYTSPLFRLSLEYARRLQPDAIFILSARYGLLDLDAEVAPYDVTLNIMSAAEARKWAERVIGQLARRADLEHDRFVLLAGQSYRKHLIPHLAHHDVPLQGLTIGRQLQHLKRLLSE